MKKLYQNPKTGIVEVWENGKKVGEVITMGDMVKKEPEKKKKRSQR